jgi:hypothetical protein
MKTYVHASDDDLKQGREALARIHRIWPDPGWLIDAELEKTALKEIARRNF